MAVVSHRRTTATQDKGGGGEIGGARRLLEPPLALLAVRRLEAERARGRHLSRGGGGGAEKNFCLVLQEWAALDAF